MIIAVVSSSGCSGESGTAINLAVLVREHPRCLKKYLHAFVTVSAFIAKDVCYVDVFTTIDNVYSLDVSEMDSASEANIESVAYKFLILAYMEPETGCFSECEIAITARQLLE